LIELSEKTGVSKSYLHDIENEKIAPSDKIIEKLFNFYKLSKEKEKELQKIIAYAKTPNLVIQEFEKAKKELSKLNSELNRMKNSSSEISFTEDDSYYAVPIYSYVRAGLNEVENMPEPLYELNIPLPRVRGDLIGIEVKGDSMEPKFHEGDIVLVKPGITPENKEIGVFVVDNKTVIKIFNKDKSGRVILTSLNIEHEPIIVDEYTEFGVIGKFWKAIVS
jgi:phage repressor protein C with HTH and peptisase S24 domain